MRRSAWLVVAMAIAAAAPAAGQEREDRILLSWDQMRAIINEVSGERPLQAVLEMVPYSRVRPRAEYESRFRESEVMARLAKEYGFSGVEIEVFPQPNQRLWQATRAELWLLTPGPRKLYDFRDIAVTIASGSESGDVAAELVDVGYGGRAEDYTGKDVKGRIVLGSASSGQLQRMAVFERGAVGVLSYNPIHPSDQDQIGSQSVSSIAPQGKTPGFGWSLSPRVGRELADLLGRGEKLTVRSVVAAESFPGRMEMVHAVIPGDGTSDQELAVSGHLYEGYIKQGANDDASGCALTLEMGRALIRLVADGKVPKPKRTIHFLWVPEISGTMAWLQKHQEVTKKLVANLNFDMEGLGLAANGSFWMMHRTPDSFPSFLNDVGANILEVMANLNRERVRYRSEGYGFGLPVLAPSGSVDPFYVLVEKHYGASDHVVYMANGVPSVMFITWPDRFYHSSKDTPDKLDPTQFKRAGVVGLGALTVLATADEAMAMKVVGETLARGTERIGQAQRKGVAYLADAGDAASLADAIKEARNAVRHQVAIEKAALKSAAVLFPNPAEAEKPLAGLESPIDQQAASLQAAVTAFYKLGAARLKLPGVEPPATELEQKAARVIVEPVAGAAGGGRGGFGGGFGPGGPGGPMTPEREAMMAAMRKIPGHMTSELRSVSSRKWTVLQIRDFLAGQFEPVPLADVMGYFEAQAKAGLVKLTEQPAEPAKKTRKRRP